MQRANISIISRPGDALEIEAAQERGKVGRAHRAAQALAGMGARRLMLAFSGRRDAGTIGTGPAGHWHCRRWSLRSWWRERPFDQPTDGIVPRRRIGKSAAKHHG
jgi:hypothetical protein